jgi:hypothetical protein
VLFGGRVGVACLSIGSNNADCQNCRGSDTEFDIHWATPFTLKLVLVHGIARFYCERPVFRISETAEMRTMVKPYQS